MVTLQGTAGAYLQFLLVTWCLLLLVNVAAKQQVNILHLGSLTGSWPGGNAMNEAAKLLASKINSDPSLLPNYEIVLKTLDTGCNRRQTEEVFYRLLFRGSADVYTFNSVFERNVTIENLGSVGDSEYVGFIGTGCSSGTMEVVPLAAQARKPIISPGARSVSLADRTLYPYYWRTTNSMASEVRSYTIFAEGLGISKVAFLLTLTSEAWMQPLVSGWKSTNVSLIGTPLGDIPETVSWGDGQYKDIKAMVMVEDTMVQASQLAQQFVKEPARMVFAITTSGVLRKFSCALFKQGVRGVIFMISGSYKNFFKISDTDLAAEGNDCMVEEIMAATRDILYIGSMQVRGDGGIHPDLSPCYKMDPLSFYDTFVSSVTDVNGDHIGFPGIFAAGDKAKAYNWGPNTADALCMYALALHEMLEVRDRAVSDLYRMSADIFAEFQEVLSQKDFEGMSGRVKFIYQGDPSGLNGPDTVKQMYLSQLRSASLETNGAFVSDIVELGILQSDTGQVSYHDDAVLVFTWDSTVLQTDGKRVVGHVSDFPGCPSGRYFNYSTQVCSGCALGKYFDAQLGTCRACSPGFYGAEVASEVLCKVCGPGTYQPHEGAIDCSDADIGFFVASAAMTSQEVCSKGFFSGERGAQSCQHCPIGTYSNETGASSCIDCPTGMTRYRASSSSEECICDKGKYMVASGVCEDCPKAMTCQLGSDVANFNFTHNLEGSLLPLVDIGHWTSKETPMSVYKCRAQDDGACLGGLPEQCSGGHFGFLCTECPPGQVDHKKKCEKCSSWNTVAFVLLFFLIVPCIVFVYYAANRSLFVNATPDLVMFTIIGMLVTTFQILAMCNSLAVPWFRSKSTEGALHFSAPFGSRISIIDASCMFDDDPVGKYAFEASGPIVLALVLFSCHCISKIIKRITPRFHQWDIDKTANSLGIIYTMLFINMLTMCSWPFALYQHPNGEMSVTLYPVILAGTVKHSVLIVASLVVLLFVMLPYAAAMVYGTKVAVRPCADAQAAKRILVRFRFLLYRFRPDVWWWGNVLLIRQSLLAFAPALPNSEPHVQVMAISTVLTTYGVWVSHARPWKSTMLNTIDAIMCVCLSILLNAATAFMDPPKQADSIYSPVIISMLVVTFGSLACGAIATVLVAMKRRNCYEPFEDCLLLCCGSTPKVEQIAPLWRKLCEQCSEFSDKELAQLLARMPLSDLNAVLSSITSWFALSPDNFPEPMPSPKRLVGIEHSLIKPTKRPSLSLVQECVEASAQPSRRLSRISQSSQDDESKQADKSKSGELSPPLQVGKVILML